MATHNEERSNGGLAEDLVINKKTHLNNSCGIVDITLKKTETSMTNLVNKYGDVIEETISEYMKGYKIQFAATCTFTKSLDDGEGDGTKTWSLSNKMTQFDEKFLVDGAYKLDEKIETYTQTSSGWRIESIDSIHFKCAQVEDMIRLSGHSYIETPQAILKKKCCINVKNKHDELCFIYAILSILKNGDITKNKDRVNQYLPYLKDINYSKCEMPMKIKDIPRFESINKQYKINVIMYNPHEEEKYNGDEEIFKNPAFDIIYRSENKNDNAIPINLLLIQEDNKYHYLGIVNLNKLLNCHGDTRIKSRWCENCLRGFGTTLAYEKHQTTCGLEKPILYTMPKEKQYKFKNWHKTISPPYVIYADFESLLVPTNENGMVHKHMPSAAGLLFMPATQIRNPLPSFYVDFYGSDCIVKFLEKLEEIGKSVKQWCAARFTCVNLHLLLKRK